MNRRFDVLSPIVLIFMAATIHAAQREFVLVGDGRARVSIHAPGESEWAARRLAERVQTLTGIRLTVRVAADTPADGEDLIALGTPQTNPVVRAALDGDTRLKDLGDEGYILKVVRRRGGAILVGAGGTPAGVNNAVSELVSWKLRLGGNGAAVPGALDVADTPELKYRILWTSDGQANWSTTIGEMHTIQKGTTGTVVVPYTRDGFLAHFTRSVDFISDHKINGYIVWGFLRDEHGGLEAGRELSRYARQRNVRILPGVCTQAAYGGFIYSQTDRFSLVGRLKAHPELCGKGKDGKTQTEAICPSKPENQQWLREGTEWLFKNLPDIGGVNLENGDLQECYTDDCIAAKSRAENDPNFLWDMMATQRPVIEVAQRLRPDAWMTFATYIDFRENAIRGLKGHPEYPPKFLAQYPANSICQWTYTGLTTPESWPAGERPPKAKFADHIGLLHHGSLWGAPVDPARWWAEPGAMLDDCSTVIQFACGRVKSCGLPGLVIKGQTGATSPANELNYLAFEYFSWHPDRTYDQFLNDRLSVCYGSSERARRFLQLLRNTTKEVVQIEKDREAAAGMAAAPDLDVRQRTRWRNLADELTRRLNLLHPPSPATPPSPPASQPTSASQPSARDESAAACEQTIRPAGAQSADASSPAVPAEQRQVLTLALNGLEIGLDRNTGEVVQLSYPQTGIMLRAGPEGGGVLDLAYPVEGFVPMRLAARYSKARITRTDNGVVISYDPLGPSRTHCPLPKGGVKAQVSIRAADDGRSVILACTIENRSEGSVPQVLFPDLRGLRPFEGTQRTLLRMTNNVTAPFAGPARPTEGAPFYGFQDGWRVFEYGGYYGPHVLRWIDFGGYKGGLSVFEKQWGGTNIPTLLLQRLEADPEYLRLAFEHRVTIEPGRTWTGAEFWLTPHPGGWAKGIEVFREYVRQVNPLREIPRRVREGLGVQTLWLIQPTETDPRRAAFTYRDMVRAAEDARGHGIDEMCVWGAFRGFQLPIELERGPGTREEFLEAVRAARKLGVHMTPFVSIALLNKPSLQPYGIMGVSPAWIYHPELIRNMDPYYQKSGYPVLGWEIAGAPLGDPRYQADALRSFQSWIDAGVTSWAWDVVCSKEGGGAKGPVIDLLQKVRAAARAADPESVLCGELVPNGNLEYDTAVLDYLWCWVSFTEPEPLMAVLGAPRFGPTIEDHAIEVKKAFCAGLFMNLLPRKPDQPNGTALLSDKPELSAALKEVAPLRKQFLPFFAEGAPLGDSFLGEPSEAFVRGYRCDRRLLVVVLNQGQEPKEFRLTSELDLWLPGIRKWKQTSYDGRGRRLSTVTGEGTVWNHTTAQLRPLEIALFEIESPSGVTPDTQGARK